MTTIKTAQEHQLKLIRVETLIDQHSLSADDTKELNTLVDEIQAYEAEHYPTQKLSDTVISAITWHNPVGEVPKDWIEKRTTIGFYTLRVWFSMSGFFEASLTHNETGVRSRLGIGEQEDLKSACEKAAQLAIQSMTQQSSKSLSSTKQ